MGSSPCARTSAAARYRAVVWVGGCGGGGARLEVGINKYGQLTLNGMDFRQVSLPPFTQ